MVVSSHMLSSATSYTVSIFILEDIAFECSSAIVLDFLPSYLFTALSSFSWVCWIAPNNRVVNQLFGVTHGMAMGILTFDWGQITYNGSPLVVPWWVAANGGLTIVIFYWIIIPILYVSHSLFSTPAAAFSSFYGSTRTSGTPLTFLWCHLAPSIIPAKYTTFPESPTMTCRSTSSLMRLTVLSSFLPPSPSHTDSHLHRSPRLSHILSSITAKRLGFTPVVHSHNNLIFMLVSCPCTKRFPIGGI